MKKVFIISLSMVFLSSYSAASAVHQGVLDGLPKMVSGNAVFDGTCCMMAEDIGATQDLLWCITGKKYSKDFIQENKKEVPALIREWSGLSIEQNELLIAVRIFDTNLPRGPWHNGFSRYFGGARLSGSWRPSYYLPYRWFAQAQEDQCVKFTMFAGRYNAALRLINPAPGSKDTFLESAAKTVFAYKKAEAWQEKNRQKLQKLEKERTYWLQQAERAQAQGFITFAVICRHSAILLYEKQDTIRAQLVECALKK
jgi:hypothetical protein